MRLVCCDVREAQLRAGLGDSLGNVFVLECMSVGSTLIEVNGFLRMIPGEAVGLYGAAMSPTSVGR